MRGSESALSSAPATLKAGSFGASVLEETPRVLLRPSSTRPGPIDTTASPLPWSPSWDRWIVVALVALAAVLRIPNLDRGYWVDEGISVGISRHALSAIPGLLRHDGSPPLFYFLLHGWMELFGTSPAATHGLVLLISLGVVIVAWWAGGSLFSRAGGLAAAALAATSPFLGWYGTETRMYTLVCLLGMAGVAFVARSLRDRRPTDVVAAVVCYVAVIYTHNWGLYLLVVTVAVVGIGAWRSGDRVAIRVGLVAAAVVGVAYLPWTPSFLAQAGSTAAPWAVPPGIGDFFADPASMLGGTLGIVVAPLLALGAAWTSVERSERSQRQAGSLRLVTWIAIATLALGWCSAQIEPSWTIRYLAVCFGPLLLAAVGALSGTTRGRVVIAAVCALCATWTAVGSLLPNPSGHSAKSNVAAVAAAASLDLHPGDLVVVAQSEQLAVLEHYLPAGLNYATPTGAVADPSVVDWRHLVQRLNSADVCKTVLPLIAQLPPGADVLEVNPLRAIGASGSAWSRAANGKVAAVDRLLAEQPSLTATRSYAEATLPRPFSAVVGELFVKQPGAVRCP